MKATIIENINKYAIQAPTKLAVADVDSSLTYQEYWERIREVASYLKSIGIRKDDFIILKNTQNIEFMVLLHGIQLTGAVAVPVEKTANEGRVESLAEETKAKHFFGDLNISGVVCHSIEDPFAYNGEVFEFEFPESEEVSMVLFTTGTTGKSKGVVIQHKAEIAVGESLKSGLHMKANNVEVLPMPMNHAFSLRRYYGNIVNGSSSIILDGVFFIQNLFNMMEEYGATSIAMAPAALGIIFQLSKEKLGTYGEQLDYLQFGTAPISEADKNRLIELLPNVRMYNVYASTEMGCVCVLNFNSEDNKPRCVGYPSEGTVFKIVDNNGVEMVNGSPENLGHITYTGNMLMKEYYNEPELTQKTIVDGYVQTSDLGYKDEEGRIFMYGRADDVLSTGGNKVSPLEVEEVAMHFEGVVDCICKAKPDRLLGAVPVLYIVGEDVDTKQLKEYLKNQLEEFKRPRAVKFIDAVPRTYNGKVDRKVEI